MDKEYDIEEYSDPAPVIIYLVCVPTHVCIMPLMESTGQLHSPTLSFRWLLSCCRTQSSGLAADAANLIRNKYFMEKS